MTLRGRSLALLPAAVLASAVLAACGGASAAAESGQSSGPVTSVRHDPAAASSPAASGSAGLQAGARVFSSAGCAGCHTLAAAHSSGSVGPDLDTLKPSYSTVLHQVQNGGGPMPSFKRSLSAAEIRAVARFVSQTAGK